MPAKEAIKILLAKSDVTLTEVAKRLGEKYGKNYSMQNLSNKIRNGTLRYNEVEEIAEILGFRIEFVKSSKE